MSKRWLIKPITAMALWACLGYIFLNPSAIEPYLTTYNMQLGLPPGISVSLFIMVALLGFGIFVTPQAVYSFRYRPKPQRSHRDFDFSVIPPPPPPPMPLAPSRPETVTDVLTKMVVDGMLHGKLSMKIKLADTKLKVAGENWTLMEATLDVDSEVTQAENQPNEQSTQKGKKTVVIAPYKPTS